MSLKLWAPATHSSHVAFPPTKILHPTVTTSKMLSSCLTETVEKVVGMREREMVLNRKKVRERQGAKRQTRCDFCLDLNRAERKGVGVRSRVCEEKKEGKQVGVNGVSFFLFSNGKDCNETRTFIAHVWGENGLCRRVCDYLPAKPQSLY